jgi:hypothetical protein
MLGFRRLFISFAAPKAREVILVGSAEKGAFHPSSSEAVHRDETAQSNA